jgi:hypothetical protein
VEHIRFTCNTSDGSPINSLRWQLLCIPSNLRLKPVYNMKLSLALAALASLSVGLAAPQPEERSASTFPGSRKKGLGYNTASYTQAFNLNWVYDWGNNPSGTLNPGVEFTPMLWGSNAAGWSSAANAAIAAGSSHLLGFNEPDNGGQSNIDPTTAAALWKANMEPFYGKAKLVGPAVTNGGGVQWLQQFLGNCTGCHIDALAMHWYDSATNWCYFTGYFTDAHNTFPNHQIWITEFAGYGSTAQQQSFLEYVLPWMETQNFIDRYAGFGDFAGNYVNSDGSLTALGTTYASTVEPPAGWNSSCYSNS